MSTKTLGLLVLLVTGVGASVGACVGDDASVVPAPTDAGAAAPTSEASSPVTKDGDPTGDASGPTEDAAPPPCSSPKTVCTTGATSVCTDTSSDSANCGACNTTCPADAMCKSAACECTNAGATYCAGGASGACVSLAADPKNCGRCGNVCPNSHCTNGQCDHIVFVTKSSYGTNLGGVTGADAICTSEAGAAKLPGTFKAWLSSGTTGPAATFATRSTTPYVLADGTTVVAESFAALTNGPQHAISLTADQTTITTNLAVMTNTNPDGTGNSASFDCAGWTSSTSNGTAYQSYYPGDLSSSDKTGWTTTDASFTACNPDLLQRLYCFQQ